MATVSLQKQKGPLDSLDKQESAVDACLDQKAPRGEPEDGTEVFQGCKDQGQIRETVTEWVQAPQQAESHEEPDEFKMMIRQGAFSSLEGKELELPSDEDIKPDCYQNVQQSSSSATLADEEEKETNTCSSKGSVCSHCTDSTSNVISLDGQKEVLVSQEQNELTPKGGNQEAAQQVLGQNSAPLSGVAMETPNQGEVASKGSVCVVTVRERQADGAGERAEGESETGEQYHKLLGQEQGKLLVPSKELVQTQDGKRNNKDIAECRIKMESDSSDDSGLSEDLSPRSASNIQETKPKDTPIEREIKRAIEREHSLRRSRGLPNASAEYVEIPLMKTILINQTVAAKSEKFHGVDRELAGKIMQHEIHEDVGREQDLVKLGKVLGFYDKGTVRQLKEKKELFEAFQNRRESSLSMSVGRRTSSSSSDSQDETSSQASTVKRSERRQSIEPPGGPYASSTPKGPGLSEGMSCQVIIMENKSNGPALKHLLTNAEGHDQDAEAAYIFPSCSGPPNNMEVDTDEMLPKENPFFKLRSLTNDIKVERDIREAQEREKELRKQRINLYGGGGSDGRPVGMDRSLRASGLDSSGSDGNYTAAHQSAGKPGMWPPPDQDRGDQVNQQKVVRGSHSSRHKTPLVHLWETGQVNGHNPHEQ
ncbi:uncharacterized protein LOC119136061 [Syngnathus acus]|uniref:uncharacterized protein LOC119136061 n=1 Tax=Syngnathus acus TaxID=161584 RepID=UPI001885E30C|nr:uncharacterized protein LOC119136061 [Syngnathus acus]